MIPPFPPLLPPAAPPEPPPWIAIISITFSLLLCICITAIVWKCIDMKRLFAPKIRKKEVSIDAFFTTLSAEEQKREECADSLNLNPVVQAKLAIDAHNREALQPKKRGAHAYGALKKLKLMGTFKTTSLQQKNNDALKRVDQALQRDTS